MIDIAYRMAGNQYSYIKLRAKKIANNKIMGEKSKPFIGRIIRRIGLRTGSVMARSTNIN
jgi:hypothetical protein